MVYQRAKAVGSLAHDRRLIKDIQAMENYRTELHVKALNILLGYGFNEKDAKDFLNKKIDKIINHKPAPLKKGENYCGLCKIKIRTKLWEEHSNSEVHKLIGPQVIAFNYPLINTNFEKEHETKTTR
jgi:hypothetical protein